MHVNGSAILRQARWVLLAGSTFLRGALPAAMLLLPAAAVAQFSASLQGTVTDPSGAVVAGAVVTLTNMDNNTTRTATTSGAGAYAFGSLAPGSYTIEVRAQGFQPTQTAATLTTEQQAGVNITLNVGNEATQVQVTAQGPALNPEENRVQTTLDTEQVRTLPLQNRGTLNLTNAAPGVSGYSQNLDNFQNEETPDANANGHFFGSNLYVIDGIESDSNITGGTNNITPNPDSLQEIALQTNTFAVDFYGGAGVTTELTTKAGNNKFHGTGEISFYNQDLQERFFFSGTGTPVQPYKHLEYSGTLGGPIYKDKTFFFASVEALASTQAGGTNFFASEDPAFVALARQNFPNTQGTRILTQFPTQGVNFQSVRFYTSPDLVTQCATPTGNCNVPFIDNVNQTTSPFNNGLQYSLRLDQNFRGGKDRIYAYYFNITHTPQIIDPRPAFSSVQPTASNLYSINYTHIFSPSILNEASFAYKRVVGNRTAPQPTIPELNINNTYGINMFGGGFGPGAFAQHQYSWRDVVTYVRGKHDIRIGFQATHGNDSADFAGNYARPSFSFNNGLVDFVQDRVYQETDASLDPLTGNVKPFQFGVQTDNFGAYVQDSWKVLPSLTLQLGLRWDDFGNPSGFLYPTFQQISNTIPVLSTKLLGAGQFDAQFANAAIRTTDNVYNGSLNNNWSPRIGVSWAPTKARDITIHGGAGLYREQISLGQIVDQLRGNPPGFITPTLGQNSGNPTQPIYSFGTSPVYPYGFALPAFPAVGLDARGGLVGSATPVQGIDPNVKTPPTLNYTLGVSQQFAHSTVATVTYTGSYSWDQLTATDFNRVAGDLIRNSGVPQRLNSSFGSVIYAGNFGSSHYNGVIFSLAQRVKSLDYQASYTWSHALDYGVGDTRYTFSDGPNSGNNDGYPDQHLIGTGYYGSSSFDEPNSFKISGSYTLPAPSQRILKQIAGGWQTTSLFVAQSGTPFTVQNFSAYAGGNNNGGCIAGGQFQSVTCGDFNADGLADDYPNVSPTTRRKFKHGEYTQQGGVFGRHAIAYNNIQEPNGFTAPAPGTEGNEARNSFRNPGLFEWDQSILKNNALPWLGGEKANLQLRVDGFNVINHTNFNALDDNLASGTFGQATSSLQPRIIQLGARFEF